MEPPIVKAGSPAPPPVPEPAPQCRSCGARFGTELENDLCVHCIRHIPPSLLKAFGDPFEYALRLRTGEVIVFHEAEIHGEWVHLTFHEGGQAANNFSFPFERGLEVRLADIVWCADAPYGS